MAGTENLEKGLRRADAEVTVQALLRLPEDERSPFLEPAGVLFRAAVQTAHEAKDWSKLTFWGSRAEKIPGLMGSV